MTNVELVPIPAELAAWLRSLTAQGQPIDPYDHMDRTRDISEAAKAHLATIPAPPPIT